MLDNKKQNFVSLKGKTFKIYSSSSPSAFVIHFHRKMLNRESNENKEDLRFEEIFLPTIITT